MQYRIAQARCDEEDDMRSCAEAAALEAYMNIACPDKGSGNSSQNDDQQSEFPQAEDVIEVCHAVAWANILKITFI